MRPLDGIRVLALENYYAGNYGSHLMRRFGAEIIKVEMPGGGDVLHNVGPFTDGPNGRRSIGEIRVMGGKKSVVINLKNPDGRAILMRLVSVCDVVWTNMKPASLRRLGIDFESLKEANPEIVYGSMSGFGHDDVYPSGPYGDLTAFDIIAQGMAGLQFRTGTADGKPGYNGLALGDQVTAILAVLGIVLALYRRTHTHEAQRVDVAMHDAMVTLMELPLGFYLVTGKLPPRGRSSTSAPFGAFPSSDGWVNLGVGGNPVWQRFCVAVDRLDWLEVDDFKSSQGRIAHRDEIEPWIAEWTAVRSTDELVAIMREHQIPCAPILDMPEVVASPQVAARDMLLTVNDPVVGERRVVGDPIKIGGMTYPEADPPALEVGQDTEAVLRDLLDLAPDEIEALEVSEAISTGTKEVRQTGR
jgi:CoA:oxalate CoA-transferase